MRNTPKAALLAALLAGPALVPAASAQAPMSSTPASPAPITDVRTVGDLASVCQPSSTGVVRLESIAYCQGFLTAAGQYHAALNPPGRNARPAFCPPEPRPTVAQAGVAFAAWAQGNPQRAAEPALNGLLRWAAETYPCPDNAPAARPGARR